MIRGRRSGNCGSLHEVFSFHEVVESQYHDTLQLKGHCAAMGHRCSAIEFGKILQSQLFELLQCLAARVSLIMGSFFQKIPGLLLEDMAAKTDSRI